MPRSPRMLWARGRAPPQSCSQHSACFRPTAWPTLLLSATFVTQLGTQHSKSQERRRKAVMPRPQKCSQGGPADPRTSQTERRGGRGQCRGRVLALLTAHPG